MIRTLAVASALALTAVVAVPAAAQLPLKLGVQAGASIPTGDWADPGVKTGYNVGLLVEVKPPLSPLGLRADVAYHQLDFEDEVGAGNSDFRILNANANAVFELGGLGFKPYLIGGLGWYQGYFGGDAGDVYDEKKSAVGFNVGGGIRFDLAGFGAHVETGYRSANLDFGESEDLKIRLIPVSFGITF